METATIDGAIDAVEIMAALATDPELLWADIKGRWIVGGWATDDPADLENAINRLEATGIGLDRAGRIWVILGDLRASNLDTTKEKP